MALQSRANSGTTYLIFLWLCMVMAPAPASITCSCRGTRVTSSELVTEDGHPGVFPGEGLPLGAESIFAFAWTVKACLIT